VERNSLSVIAAHCAASRWALATGLRWRNGAHSGHVEPCSTRQLEPVTVSAVPRNVMVTVIRPTLNLIGPPASAASCPAAEAALVQNQRDQHYSVAMGKIDVLILRPFPAIFSK